MEKRIFFSLFLTGALAIILTIAVSLTIFHVYIESQVYDELKSSADIITSALEMTDTDRYMQSLSDLTDYRVTLIDKDGRAMFDTNVDVSSLDLHSDRPEIEIAIKSGEASGRRSSKTFGCQLYYYAKQLADGSILRLSMFDTQISKLFIDIAVLTSIMAVFLLIAAIFISSRLTARITEPVRSLAVDIEGSDHGEEKLSGIYPEFAPLVDKIRGQSKEIKHQLARVEKEKNRLSTIINNMDEGLVILDNELRIIMVNESAFRLLKSPLTLSECAGKRVSEVFLDSEVCGCIERADSMTFMLDGRYLQLHVNHVVTSVDRVGRIGLILDITERTEIEHIKQEFTANVSHELKTPLTSISGYAELIESGMASGEDITLFAGRIHRESVRMLTLISDIIKLSQLDEESDGEGFEPVELYTLCRECMDVLEYSAEKHNVTLSLVGEPCELLGSANELEELVYNLIDNAIRYNRPNGRVDVKIELNPIGYSSGTVAMLSVSDTGIGISKEHSNRVFERFYRVDKSRSKATGGTGLGLAIVKHVAERHGARLELDSELGKGTTVRVIFYDNVSENL